MKVWWEFDKPLDISNMLGFFTSLANQRSIVIVDDDKEFCKTLSDILEQRGFGVRQVCDPHADVELMTEVAQAILLDMKLNGITGVTFASRSGGVTRCCPS